MINELLAPAGSLEAVKVAINYGADAVYCSGVKFGARSFITNLTDEEIVEAARYVHLHSKKIYITLNTLIFENEIDEVKAYIDFLYHHVDAIIVQDYGVIHYIRSNYPDFPIHISTQCSVHNIDDLMMLKDLGVDRVVLAREVPLEEIRKMNELGVDLEIFIHGALCFSYSGMCYLSYYKGGRSGNRGSCAQPCRQDYELIQDGEKIAGGPLLSMKDLNTIANIKTLLKAGVTSLKIEGRAKSLEYVAAVTKTYRKLIDDFNNGLNPNVDETYLNDLYSSFSREITKGYLFGDTNKGVTTDNSVKHQGIYIGKVIGYYKNQIKIKLKNNLDLLDGIRIIDGDKEYGLTVTRIIENGQMVKSAKEVAFVDVKDKINPGAFVFKTSSSKVSKELKTYKHISNREVNLSIDIKQDKQVVNLSSKDIVLEVKRELHLEKAKTVNKENVIAQFTKTNGLPISYINIDYRNDEDLYLPIPVINEIRSTLLDMLKEKLETQVERKYHHYPLKLAKFNNERVCDSLSLVEGVDYFNSLINEKKLSKSNLAFHLAEINKDSIISPYFGVCNSLAINFFRNYTNNVIILSYESTLENSISLSRIDKSLGYLVEYNEPLMHSKHCVVSKASGFDKKHCGMCYKHKYQLKDGNNLYNLKFHDCTMIIEGKLVKRKSDTQLIDVVLK